MRIAQSTGPALLVLVLAACVATEPMPSVQPPDSPWPSPSNAAATPPAPVSASAAIVPSNGPSVTPGPEVTPDATPEPPSDGPSLPPSPGAPRLAGVVSAWQGGCPSLYLRTALFGADACGPFEFDPLLASDPIRVEAGARLVLRAPAGASFSGAVAGLGEGWTVRMAPADALVGAEEVWPDGMPTGTGTVPLHGPGPDTSIIVTMPSKPGLRVVQFSGPITRGDWTWTESVYYWLVRVV